LIYVTLKDIVAQVERNLNLPPKQNGNIFSVYHVHKAMHERGETTAAEMNIWVEDNGGHIEGDNPFQSTITFDNPDDAFAFKLRWC
jgi:hypothetical protein